MAKVFAAAAIVIVAVVVTPQSIRASMHLAPCLVDLCKLKEYHPDAEWAIDASGWVPENKGRLAVVDCTAMKASVRQMTC